MYKGFTRNNRTLLASNKGTTMLETMVAFVVLMIILGVLYNIIAFCSELRMSAVDTSRAMQTFNTHIYSNTAETSAEIDIMQCKTKNNQPLFYLELNTEKTDPLNIGTNVTESTNPGLTKKLSLYQIEATTYSYHTSETDSDTIAVPKAISFKHKKDSTEQP